MFNIKNLRRAKAEIKALVLEKENLDWQLEEERKTIIKLIEKNNEFRYKIEQLKSQLPNRDTKNGRFTSKKK